jgi:hypothetical protein
VALQVCGYRFSIDRARALKGLRKYLSVGVNVKTGVVIGVDARDLFVQL